MNTVLDCIEIYSGDIEHAWDVMERAFEDAEIDLDIDDVLDGLQDKLSYSMNWDSPTNSIIAAMYDNAISMIEDKYPDVEIEVFVNGYDTHFDIKMPEIGMEAEERRTHT